MDNIEQILQEIENRIYCKPEELAKAVKMPKEELVKVLQGLIRESRVAKTKDGKYALASTM
ncbi:MAG: hypothetical protein RRY08_02465, partial [Christensenella sp.]